MDRIMCRMPCLSESKSFNRQEIYEVLFDKKGDKRYLEGDIQRFITLNRKMFDFLGVEVRSSGTGSELSLQFISGQAIGAVPVRMPYDGIARKDFQVIPRFSSGPDSFSELTQLLERLDYSVVPEYSYEDKLVNPVQLRPAIYYEAAKYTDLFDEVCRYRWVKFDSASRVHDYPKSGTDWNRYSLLSFDPNKTLEFRSKDNILSTGHYEWRQLTYVFGLAGDILTRNGVPGQIKYRYSEKIRKLTRETASVRPLKTASVQLRATDPPCVKALKEQANLILSGNTIVCPAWRIDMAELFERYVQYIVGLSVKDLAGSVHRNTKIRGSGSHACWGLKYLEPDIMIRLQDRSYMADAKYKAHYYAMSQNSDILKETHRADLHQLLAYCSFLPEKDKTGILFYPAGVSGYRKTEYRESINGIRNTVILFGIPFDAHSIENSVREVRELFR